MADVVRIHSSSGTTAGDGRRIHEIDLDHWAECIARLLTAGGVTRDDIVQIAFGYGLFTGDSASITGRTDRSLRDSGLFRQHQRQIMVMKDFGTTASCARQLRLHLARPSREGHTTRRITAPPRLFGADPGARACARRLKPDCA